MVGKEVCKVKDWVSKKPQFEVLETKGNLPYRVRRIKDKREFTKGEVIRTFFIPCIKGDITCDIIIWNFLPKYINVAIYFVFYLTSHKETAMILIKEINDVECLVLNEFEEGQLAVAVKKFIKIVNKKERNL